jgi:hypothetical protein
MVSRGLFVKRFKHTPRRCAGLFFEQRYAGGHGMSDTVSITLYQDFVREMTG